MTKLRNKIGRLLVQMQDSLQAGRWPTWAVRIYERLQKNKRIRYNLLQAIPFWMASIITGLVAVAYAKLFLGAELLSVMVYEQLDWGIFLVLPASVILAWWLVRRFAPGARGSGIPQVIAALEITQEGASPKVDRLLSIRIVVVKMLSSLLMVFGGAAIGREGPTIQISAAIFKKVNEVLPSWWPKVSLRNMILTGAAAGLAAAFNTPLGGIVFAVEELSKTHFTQFRTAIFTAVIIAGLAAQGISGPYLYLGYPKVGEYSWTVLWAVVLVAMLAGVLAAVTAKVILWIFAWKDRFRSEWQHVGYLLLSSTALASMVYFVSELAIGSGKDVMTLVLFSEDKGIDWYVPFLRMGGPILSFTSGASGGIFAPSLSAGAGIGGVVADFLGLAPTEVHLLAIAGMVAFLTGITRSPFTSSILVLEMTDRHSLIFYLMAAGLIANLFAYSVDRKSLYEHLKLRFLRDAAAATVPATDDPPQQIG